MRHPLVLIPVVAALLGLGAAVQAQAQSELRLEATGPRPIVIGSSYSLASEVLGDTRQINVWTPTFQAEEGRRYTVLYVLDGALDQDFQHIAGLAQLGDLSWTYEPLIVVGVQTRNRQTELTPPPSDARYISAFPDAGRAEAFRRFLEREVIPFVEGRYPASGRRAIAGESLAGLFVVDTLLTAPHLFDDYFAISPSLWWDDQVFARQAADKMSDRDLSGKRVWLAMADEGGTMQAGVDILRQAIAGRPGRGPDLHYSDRSAHETHATIYHGAILDGLRRFYGTPHEDSQEPPWYMRPGGRPAPASPR